MIRGLLALLLLSALLGAPRPASAAVNELSEASVSPSSGSVTTVFVMRVDYDGGFPATDVTVTVAGLTLPMVLERGTATAGTWAVATPLPAGTWPLTFHAAVLRGPAPSLVGPTVSVSGVSPTPPPTAPGTQAPPQRSSGTVDPPGDDPGSVDEPGAAPASSSEATPGDTGGKAQASPDGATEPSTPASGAAPATQGAPGGDPDDDTTGNGAPASPTERPGSGPGGAPGDASAPPDAGGDGAPAASDEPNTTGGGSDSPIESDGLLAMVLGVGLVGVAAVALIGTLVLVAGRRRQEPEEAAATVGVTPETAGSGDLLTRRTLRRARMRVGDDPIVSALGVDEQMQARRDRVQMAGERRSGGDS